MHNFSKSTNSILFQTLNPENILNDRCRLLRMMVTLCVKAHAAVPISGQKPEHHEPVYQ